MADRRAIDCGHDWLRATNELHPVASARALPRSVALLCLGLEYRFDIISILEGAVFIDAGNTFTLKDDPFRPHAQFHVNDFYQLLAVGPGAGLRFDFSYFIIRIDAAYPLYDPALDGPYKSEIISYYDDLGFTIPAKKVAINLAINYPF